MKLQSILALGIIATTVSITAVSADSYSTTSTTVREDAPVAETRETTVIRDQQPVIVEQRSPEVVVVKKKQHHLINVGPVKVF